MRDFLSAFSLLEDQGPKMNIQYEEVHVGVHSWWEILEVRKSSPELIIDYEIDEPSGIFPIQKNEFRSIVGWVIWCVRYTTE